MCGQSKEFKFDAVPCWEAAADEMMGAVPEPCDPASELDFDLDPSSIQLGEWCEYHEPRNPRGLTIELTGSRPNEQLQILQELRGTVERM